jgi:hypothetical protein
VTFLDAASVDPDPVQLMLENKIAESLHLSQPAASRFLRFFKELVELQGLSVQEPHLKREK